MADDTDHAESSASSDMTAGNAPDGTNLMSYFNENGDNENASGSEVDTTALVDKCPAPEPPDSSDVTIGKGNSDVAVANVSAAVVNVTDGKEKECTNDESNKTDFLAEAERQAAIAAALSQTSSTPSIVAGMARQLATTENSYGGTVVDLPPLPDQASGGGGLSNSVPVPNEMKPVKFDHVKVVFDRLWFEEFEKGTCEHLNDGEYDENHLEVEVLSQTEVNEVTARLEKMADASVVPDTRLSSSVSTEGSPPTEESAADAATSDSKQSEESTINGKSTSKPTVEYLDESTEKTKQTTLPDSFLRFLLLVAKVPIIIEEGKQLHRSKQRSLKDSESNSFIAAKRCLEIYKSAKTAYDTINANDNRGTHDDDATSSFFASCSGDDSGVIKAGDNSIISKPIKDDAVPISPKSNRTTRKSLVDINMGSSAATAFSSASSMFSSVMSKVGKKDFKKFMPKTEETPTKLSLHDLGELKDYEIVIDQEMLGLTVENVLERTIIRTLLPEGAAKRSGARIGSLIAKVGNVDTSNLTHFETIDELRQSQRPLKLTLRHISSEVLRSAREEMGRLIRGREEEGNKLNNTDAGKPWRVTYLGEESFDSILRKRWPSKAHRAAPLPASIMTRNEMIHRAGKDLIRILSLFVVGLERELSAALESSPSGDKRTKHLKEAIESTSKVLIEYAKKHPEVEDKPKSENRGNSTMNQGSSFYPVPPGRVGKKNVPPPPKGKSKKQIVDTPLLRIGDALHRTTTFLVEITSATATTLRWDTIDYLCVVLDLDSDNELAEKEAASSTEGGNASQINDLGSAGSILKLIVVNCSTVDDSVNSLDTSHNSYSGNSFLAVVYRLAASKSVSARISACSLGPVLWSHLDFPRQLQLRGVIARALHDVDLTVRKSTATVLHDIAELVFDRRSVPWLVLMCERSMTDPEPQLRAAAMTLTWHLAEHLPNAFLGDASKGSRSLRRLPPRTDPTFMDVYLLQCKLLPVASNLAEDKMPSVRLSVAAQCDRLCSAMGEHWFNVIIDLLQALLSDEDERVRCEAITCMPRLVESVVIGTTKGQTITVLESLLPQALKIQTDSSPEVRAALATATGDLLIFLVGAEDNTDVAPPSPGRGALARQSQYKKYIDDTLIPILQKLLQDSNPEVTTASLRAVTNASRSSTGGNNSHISTTSHTFDSTDDDVQSISSHQSLQSHTSYERRKPVFIPVLSEEQVLRLLPTLSNLATSREWRVRQSAVEIVPALLGCTYQHETRHEISKLCLKLMNDKVDAVRKTAAECLCLGGSSLARHGEEDDGLWVTNIVVPHLLSCSQSEDSKQRLLCLKMIEIIIANGLCPTTQKADIKLMDISLNSSSFDTTSDSVCDAESTTKMILDIASSLAADQVANVRLNVGRVLGSVMLLLQKTDANFAVSILERQLEDERGRPGGGDRDVLYFSQQAILTLEQPRRMSSNYN